MNSIPFEQVTLRRGLLAEKERLSRRKTIPAVYRQFSLSGRIGAFAFNWKEGKPKQPHFFWDSDVAKWIEGAAYSMRLQPSAALEKKIDALVANIEKNQRADGYFNIYYTVCEPGKEWTDRNRHELYCAGHLLEGAIAYFETTGKRQFLSCMEKYMAYIRDVFMVKQSAAFVTPGHQEIELALLRLYRLTKDENALELARFFIEQRSNNDKDKDIGFGKIYAQDDHPVREMREAKGHAVRALYYYCAVADLAAETDDPALLETCRSIFHDIVTHKMYITGGLGFPHGEAFSEPDYLPNDISYCETCASIAMVYFCARMLNIEKKSCYADVIERELYNGVISGSSLSGDAFFYENPLGIHQKARAAAGRVVRYSAITERVENFSCSCCPPNLCRFLPSLGSLVYSRDGGDLYVHQYADSCYEGDGMRLSLATAYPMNGEITVKAEGVSRLLLRIPDWCEETFTLDAPYTVENGYAVIAQPAGEVHLSLPMRPVLMAARASVADCAGRVAVMRGPIVYCAEEVDNGADLDALYLSSHFRARVRREPAFGSLPVLLTSGYRRRASEALYERAELAEFDETEIRLIPYACFANRGPSDMLVWLNVK